MDLGLEILKEFDQETFDQFGSLMGSSGIGRPFDGIDFKTLRARLTSFRDLLYRAAHGALPLSITRAETQRMNLLVCELVIWLKAAYPDAFNRLQPEKRLSPAQSPLYRALLSKS